MVKPKIIITDPIHQRGIDLLKEKNFTVIEAYNFNECLLELAKDASAILVRYKSISREIIKNSRNLKIIAKHGVGYDHIDIKAANERSIPVTITPGVNAEAVAEHALALMLNLAKKISLANYKFKSNTISGEENFTGIELFKKKLGIIGLGRIGINLAKKCKTAFDMEIFAYDPNISGDLTRDMDIKLVNKLETLLKVSDFISIHVPLISETKNMIGEKQLRMMKGKAYLINTSRGGIIEEKTLIKALKKGWIKGAGLDVFQDEPLKTDNPIIKCENVVITPHIGGATLESTIKMSTMAAEEIIRVLEGRKAKNIINPQIYSSCLGSR